MPVSMIGTRGCGKSTLVGFLHQSMEKYTIKNPQKFAYYMDPETTDVCLKKIRNRLWHGNFPRATARGDFRRLSFLLSFEAEISDVIRYIGSEGLSALRHAFDYENTLVLTVFDVAGEDIEEFGMHKSTTERLKEIFESNIMIVLIDCSKLTKDIGGEKGSRMNQYDAEMSRILSRYEEYRASNYPGQELHPIVFFTKMDKLDPEISADLPNHTMGDILDMDKEYDEEEVREDGEELLKSYLTGTYQNIVGSRVVGVDLHEAKYFFSWAGVEGDEGIKPAEENLDIKRIDVEKEEGGTKEVKSNYYPYNHYQEFISHLSDLSNEYSDREEKVKEYLNRDSREMV